MAIKPFNVPHHRYNTMEKPHFIWWFAHIVLGVITGLVVYLLYKEKNPTAARRHLIGSVVIMIVFSLFFLSFTFLA